MRDCDELLKELEAIRRLMDDADITPFGKIGKLLDKASDATYRAIRLAEKLRESAA